MSMRGAFRQAQARVGSLDRRINICSLAEIKAIGSRQVSAVVCEKAAEDEIPPKLGVFAKSTGGVSLDR
jgi:hypothetical protein